MTDTCKHTKNTPCHGIVERRTLFWPDVLCDSHYEEYKNEMFDSLVKALAEYTEKA